MEPRRRDCVRNRRDPFAITGIGSGRRGCPLTKREKAVLLGGLDRISCPTEIIICMKVPIGSRTPLFTSAHSIRTQASCWCTVDQVLLINRDTYSTSSGLPSSRNLSMRSGLRLAWRRVRVAEQVHSSRRRRLEPSWRTGQEQLKICHNWRGLTETKSDWASWAIRAPIQHSALTGRYEGRSRDLRPAGEQHVFRIRHLAVRRVARSEVALTSGRAQEVGLKYMLLTAGRKSRLRPSYRPVRAEC